MKDVDVVSKSNRSKSSKRVSHRSSSRGGLSHADEADSQYSRDIEQPPMNEEIEHSEVVDSAAEQEELL